MDDSQDTVFSFLADPAAHDCTAEVKRIDTHGAVVFLAGSHAYKVKRAVLYPFMDFSTLEKRKAACDAEIAVNRQFAPDIYLGSVPITRDGNGLHIGGTGDIVEWAVHMRRFDEKATLDRIAERNSIDAELIDKIARTVSDSHLKAPVRSAARATTALYKVLDESLGELAARKDIFPARTVQTLQTALLKAYRRSEPLLIRREMNGKVRRCHGDLHLRNIMLKDGTPVLFDAIEFDEAIACIDILYDLAFLLMDLVGRGLQDQACRLLNRYLWLAEDERAEIEGLALMPLFLSLRGVIRAKVLAIQSDLSTKQAFLRKEARQYAEVASRFMVEAAPRIIAIGGLSGTGKSVLAASLAPGIGRLPGAVHLRSDIERKKMLGCPEKEHLPPQGYTAAASARVYRLLGELTAAAVAAGQSVIVDATFMDAAQRTQIEAVAAHTGGAFQGIWLEAPVGVLRDRVRNRTGDASDATVGVVEAQDGKKLGQIAWQHIDASQSMETVLARAHNILQRPQ
jgi:aminoglycoside phosphotransferase family enzyme/predicted kinase